MPYPLLLITLLLAPFVAKAGKFQYPIDGITSMNISSVEFTVTCGQQDLLIVESDEESDFKMSYRNQSLELSIPYRKRLFFYNSPDVSATIVVRETPENISVSAGADGTIDDCFGPILALHSSSGSTLALYGNGSNIRNFTAKLSSGASVKIKKQLAVDELVLSLSSGASLRTDDSIVINHAVAKASSGAFAELCGAVSVTGKVSSGAQIEVSRQTTRLNTSESSGGFFDVNCD